jgi:hypothetical protein
VNQKQCYAVHTAAGVRQGHQMLVFLAKALSRDRERTSSQSRTASAPAMLAPLQTPVPPAIQPRRAPARSTTPVVRTARISMYACDDQAPSFPVQAHASPSIPRLTLLPHQRNRELAIGMRRTLPPPPPPPPHVPRSPSTESLARPARPDSAILPNMRTAERTALRVPSI